MSEYKKENRERVSVKVAVLESLRRMINEGCYEQACIVIDILLDPQEREKKRKTSSRLYFATKEAKTPEERAKAWAIYTQYLNDSIV